MIKMRGISAKDNDKIEICGIGDGRWRQSSGL